MFKLKPICMNCEHVIYEAADEYQDCLICKFIEEEVDPCNTCPKFLESRCWWCSENGWSPEQRLINNIFADSEELNILCSKCRGGCE